MYKNIIYNKMEHLYASIIGTLTAEILTIPLCTIKTVYQVNNTLNINQTINLIYKKSGYKGFFQASIPAIFSQIVSTSTKYTFYQSLKNARKTESNDIINNSINGMFGAIFGSLFSHPIDVWKNYVQRNEKFNLKKCYQGYSASIYKNVVLYSILFPIYDYYKLTFNSIYIASVLTTITVSSIIQPFDYYKTVKMAGSKINTHWYRGFNLMLLRSIPHFLITMTITEKLIHHQY